MSSKLTVGDPVGYAIVASSAGGCVFSAAIVDVGAASVGDGATVAGGMSDNKLMT